MIVTKHKSLCVCGAYILEGTLTAITINNYQYRTNSLTVEEFGKSELNSRCSTLSTLGSYLFNVVC